MGAQQINSESASARVFETLAESIFDGRLRPGDPLPPERELARDTGVTRGVIREAVKRLQQAGLLASQQGSGHRVLDYRQHGGLDLMPWLVYRADGTADLNAVRSVG